MNDGSFVVGFITQFASFTKVAHQPSKDSSSVKTPIVHPSSASRLSNFNIGVTNKNPSEHSPSVWATAPGHYTPCVSYPGALGLGEKKSFRCVDRGRYVLVQLMRADVLTLCEVVVLGGRNSGREGGGRGGGREEVREGGREGEEGDSVGGREEDK
jgi:hypothetical protein